MANVRKVGLGNKLMEDLAFIVDFVLDGDSKKVLFILLYIQRDKERFVKHFMYMHIYLNKLHH